MKLPNFALSLRAAAATIVSGLVITTSGFAQEAAEPAPSESSSLFSGLFVEPGVTYQRLLGTVNYPAPFQNSTGSSEGLGLVARVGIHVGNIIFAGLDGRYAKPQFKDSSNNMDAPSETYDFGPMVGVQMPSIVGLRFWGTYILGGQADPEKSNNVDVKFLGASGWRLGAGFKVAIVSFNLEYQQINYNSTSLQQVGPFSTSTSFDSVKYSNSGFVASVTLPLAL